jgi:hypothetical protein
MGQFTQEEFDCLPHETQEQVDRLGHLIKEVVGLIGPSRTIALLQTITNKLEPAAEVQRQVLREMSDEAFKNYCNKWNR